MRHLSFNELGTSHAGFKIVNFPELKIFWCSLQNEIYTYSISLNKTRVRGVTSKPLLKLHLI